MASEGLNTKNIHALADHFKAMMARQDEQEKKIVSQNEKIKSLTKEMADLKRSQIMMEAGRFSSGPTVVE